jgi:Fur family ferric uptake transcriptional regulator
VALDRAEQALAAIRESGGRITSDRRAIIEALAASTEHLTVEQLAERVWTRHPDVNLATIYRTVELVEHLGIGFHVHMGHGPSRWHLADEVHQHLVCSVCGAVTDIPDETLDPLREQIVSTTGFVVDAHHFSLTGTCAACSRVA